MATMGRVVRALLLGMLAAGLAVGRAAADDSQDLAKLWHESFTGEEQRIIHAMTADPEVDEALRQGLGRVLANKGDARMFAYEKARFQAEWLDRITSFSSKYKAQDPALMSRMSGLPKPEEKTARTQVPWFDQIDREKFGGRLIPGVRAALNPHELTYSIASLRSLSAERKEETLGKLNMAATFKVKPETVVGKLADTCREWMQQDIEQVQTQTLARVRSARAQLEELAPTMASAKEEIERAAEPDLEEAAELSRTFDGGSRTTKKKEPAPAVRATPEGELEDADIGASEIPEEQLPQSARDQIRGAMGKLQPSSEAGAAPKKGLAVADIPVPKTSGVTEKGSGSGGWGLKKILYAGGGAILGGMLLGLLFGPIGAVIGALGGAYLGAKFS